MSEVLNANNHAQKNIAHANDGGMHGPLDPPLLRYANREALANTVEGYTAAKLWATHIHNTVITALCMLFHCDVIHSRYFGYLPV